MTDDSFDLGDLYGLEVCLRDLDEMLARSDEVKTDKAVAYATVKCFELTYELSIKTMRKYLIARTHKEDDAKELELPDFIRLADQFGLVRNGWPAWREYRRELGKTVHTYSQPFALEVIAESQAFSEEVHVLLDNLKRRLEEQHD